MIDDALCKIAFVGAGYMASEHMRAFLNVPGVELSGIFSRSRHRAERLAFEFGVNMVSDSIAELYETSRANLVVISVPEISAREVCLEAFKYPWICLIEKPPGYSLLDANIIYEAALKYKRSVYVAFNRRHYSSTRAVLDDISKTGGQRLIHVCDQEDQNVARDAGQPELVVQNWMYSNSIHLVDYFNLLGRGKIVAVVPIIHWTPECPFFVMAKIMFDSGDVGIYEAVWNGPGPWAVTVTTREKRWEARPLEQAAVQLLGSRKLDPVAVDDCDIKFKPGLRVQASEAVKAVFGKTHSLPSLEDAIKSMRLVHAIYEGCFGE